MNEKSISLDVENARNLTMEQLSSIFISTSLYKKLLSRRHHILLGARGQGKTALFRMLAFEGFRVLAKNDTWAQRILQERKFVGIYLPTKLEWVQSVSSENSVIFGEKDAFRWKLNLSSCIAFVETALACIKEYGENRRSVILNEMKFSSSVASVWQLGSDCDTVKEVASRLKHLGHQWQDIITRMTMFKQSLKDIVPERIQTPMSVFYSNIFDPLKRGIDILVELLHLPESTAWLLCIDEAESMTVEQQCIINTFMRSSPENLFIKIATMPFSHYTLATDFTNAPLIPGNDFEYLTMDKEIKNEQNRRTRKSDIDFTDTELQFGEQLLQRVIATCYPERDISPRMLEKLFGTSELLDNAVDTDWSEDSEYVKLFKKYASRSYIARAKELIKMPNKSKFMNEVGRKIRGTLLLRKNKETCTGNKKSSIYSGGKLLLKCAEGNPRMFIRIVNSMLPYATNNSPPLISIRKQEEVLVDLARNFHNQIRSYQVVGPELYRLVEAVGNRFHDELYEKPLTGDVVQSVEVDEKFLADSKNKNLMISAIQYGVFRPNDVSRINYGSDAEFEGVYHLSYAFCPLFRLQPRMGKSIKLVDIIISRKTIRSTVPFSMQPKQMEFNYMENLV